MEALNSQVAAAQQLLSHAIACYRQVTYASSLGAEAMVLTDIIASHEHSIDVFTIDTGRLHPETYDLLDTIQQRYPSRIRVVYPDAAALERLVTHHGVNGFYSSIEARLECCRVRKVEPFRRAISGFSAWITGIRRSQSAERSQAEQIEWDAQHSLYKISPLLEWSDEDLWDYIRTHNLPYNRLHDAGYPSIGCSPCTRAIQPGEPPRAGRWWWEESTSRECGLHAHRPASGSPRAPASS